VKNRICILLCLLLVTPLVATAENLYQQGTYRPLMSDRRAYGVGDVLTVQIVESASASATAGTRTGTTSGVGVSTSTPTNPQRRYGASVDDNFDGSGKIARTGKLLGQVTVLVQEVLKNGDLKVEGEQQIAINGEKQLIRLSGVVRPADISEGNLVVSNRVANAHIVYVGDGVLAEGESRNWLSRLFSAFPKIF
jgi:flagellar L-ring protein precursor FlgH